MFKAFTLFANANRVDNNIFEEEEIKIDPEDTFRELNDSFEKNKKSLKEAETVLNNKENELMKHLNRASSLEWALKEATETHNMPATHPMIVDHQQQKESADNMAKLLQPEVNNLRKQYNRRMDSQVKLNEKIHDLRNKLNDYNARIESAESQIALASLQSQMEEMKQDVYTAESLAEITIDEKTESIENEFKRLGIQQ